MSDGEEIVEAYMAAMRRGPAAEEDMLALFAEDAVYEEPFSGQGPAIGAAAIRERLRIGWQNPLPDMELDVLTVEVTGDRAVTTWECRSSAFETPARGRDEYEFRAGRIASLRVELTPGT